MSVACEEVAKPRVVSAQEDDDGHEGGVDRDSPEPLALEVRGE
jgi:hypothetical protein